LHVRWHLVVLGAPGLMERDCTTLAIAVRPKKQSIMTSLAPSATKGDEEQEAKKLRIEEGEVRWQVEGKQLRLKRSAPFRGVPPVPKTVYLGRDQDGRPLPVIVTGIRLGRIRKVRTDDDAVSGTSEPPTPSPDGIAPDDGRLCAPDWTDLDEILNA
jgi:hypothetical protein